MQERNKITKGGRHSAGAHCAKTKMSENNQDQKDINLVKLRGRIVNIYEVNKVAIFTLSDGNQAHPNYPKITFFGDRAKEALEHFEKYDNVEITAMVQSKKREAEGKTYYTQALYGRSIRRSKKVMESMGIEGGKEFAPPVKRRAARSC